MRSAPSRQPRVCGRRANAFCRLMRFECLSESWECCAARSRFRDRTFALLSLNRRPGWTLFRINGLTKTHKDCEGIAQSRDINMRLEFLPTSIGAARWAGGSRGAEDPSSRETSGLRHRYLGRLVGCGLWRSGQGRSLQIEICGQSHFVLFTRALPFVTIVISIRPQIGEE